MKKKTLSLNIKKHLECLSERYNDRKYATVICLTTIVVLSFLIYYLNSLPKAESFDVFGYNCVVSIDGISIDCTGVLEIEWFIGGLIIIIFSFFILFLL